MGRQAVGRTAWALAGALFLIACGPRRELTAPSQAEHAEQAPATADALTRSCEHSYEVLVARAGAGSPAVLTEFMANCRRNGEQRRATLGEPAWAERTRCVLAAEDADALGICDGRQPAPAPTPTVATDDTYTRLCRHLMKIIEVELSAASGVQTTEAERAERQRSCVETTRKEHDQDPAGFEREMQCVLAAQTLEEIVNCDI